MDGEETNPYEVREVALRARSRGEVFAHLAGLIDADPAQVVAALERREAEGDTAVGDGVAIPHAAIPGLDRGVLVDVRLDGAARWGAAPGEVRRCFCVLAPEGRHDTHVALLAEAARRAVADPGVGVRPRRRAAAARTQARCGLSAPDLADTSTHARAVR